MIPAAFDYAAPSTVDEAIALLQEHGDDAKLLAGGHSLLPLMKLRLAFPSFLVDLARIPGLTYIREEGDRIAIGAMTTHYALQSSDVLATRIPLLSQAAGMVGDMQVRNRGTIGGSISHADPASDLPAVVVALRAEIIAQGPGGARTIAAGDFFQDIWTSALEPDEVVTEIRIPAGNGRGQNYQKFRQRSADWAIVGVAVNLVRDNGAVTDVSVVLTNVGPTPMRAAGVEQVLAGVSLTPESIREASARAGEGLEPSGELKASGAYKRHLAQVLTRRALEAAIQV
jgi:aerobic carbon-monoxide dehydrogenase medium subunit